MAGPQIYTLEHPRALRTARENIVAMRQEAVEANGTGYASSYDDYRYRSGIVRGLELAIGKIDDATGENK